MEEFQNILVFVLFGHTLKLFHLEGRFCEAHKKKSPDIGKKTIFPKRPIIVRLTMFCCGQPQKYTNQFPLKILSYKFCLLDGAKAQSHGASLGHGLPYEVYLVAPSV